MDLPPPLPANPKPAGKNRIWILFVILGVCIMMAIIAGVVGLGIYGVKRAQEQKAAVNEMEKAFASEDQKMAKALREGKSEDRNASFDRAQAELNRAAEHLNSGDAAAARGMMAWMKKLQVQMQALDAAAHNVGAAKVFAFDIRDRSTIDEDRKLVREMISANTKVTEMIVHGSELAAAELDAAGVPPRIREATLKGYAEKQGPARPLMLQIRKCDQTLAESALSVLDLLDQNWGKWKRNDSGRLVFNDQSTASAFNDYIKTIQKTTAEETQLQQELADRVQGFSGASGVKPVPSASNPVAPQ